VFQQQQRISLSATKDSLFIGQGYKFERFRYIVVAQYVVIQLSSKRKQPKFDPYSDWLLSAIRDHIKKKKTLDFP
jgi:hypothetical protein